MALIATLVTSEPILIVGVAVMASENVAVTTILSPLTTELSESESVNTTVGLVWSLTSKYTVIELVLFDASVALITTTYSLSVSESLGAVNDNALFG